MIQENDNFKIPQNIQVMSIEELRKEKEKILKQKERKYMKLLNIKDVDRFFEIINSCDGQVYLISKEGDRLNLKSTLCQFVAKEVFSGEVDELEVVAHNPEDAIKLMKFMMEQ